MKILLALCVLGCFSVLGAFGDKLRVQDTELIETETRVKRQLDAGAGKILDWIERAIENTSKCAANAGCHKGYCWTWCGISLSGGDWCYTTRTYSQSFQYIQCTSDAECSPCWKCAGSCTL